MNITVASMWLAGVLIRSAYNKIENELHLNALWMLRRTYFFSVMKYGSACASFFATRWRKSGWADGGRRHISHLPPQAVTSSVYLLSSPVFFSPLLSSLLSSFPLMAGAVRGSCSGDIIMSHFTRVLPSISPRININHPSVIPHTTTLSVSTLPLINTDVRRSSK